jgi:hypothetical protein
VDTVEYQRRRPKVCKRCGHGPTPETVISWRGLCASCQLAAVSAVIDPKTPQERADFLRKTIAGMQKELDRLEAAQ